MKRRASPSLPGIVVLGVAACTAPGLDHVGTIGEPPGTTTTTSAGSGASDDPPPTTGTPEPSTTTTGDPGTTAIGSGSTSELGSTTDDDPLAPPAIVAHDLGPDPLQQAGPIDVAISTVHADGVRMRVDDGDAVELSPVGVDKFVGQIAIYTALDNGDHTATFVAWRSGLESESVKVPFKVALPPPGSELFWEGDSAIGKGTVVALAVTPAHELIELGTYYPQGQARCYLRRRDLGGTWGPGDLVELKPGVPCSAIDLAVDLDGALHVLVDKIENGELRWWLGKIDAWAAEPANVGSGVVGDVARALALDSTRVAVCGTKPKPGQVDAAMWLFVPNDPGKKATYDYVPVDFATKIDETPHDCTISGERLLMVGDAKGMHDLDNIVRTRLFLLAIDIPSDAANWTIAAPEPTLQSGARVLSLDNKDRVITGGYACNEPCDAVAELRMFSPAGTQLWRRALDSSVSTPRAMTSHPSEYAIFLSARDKQANVTSFFAEAWFPLEAKPVWTYEHQDGVSIQAATAVALGPYGQIYAGGVTTGGYPALAIIAP